MRKPGIVRNGLIALIVIAFAGLALAQIGGVLGGSAEPSSLSRILPARITVLGDAGKARGGTGDPWRLFDGDTERGFAWGGPGAVRLRLVLAGPHTLAAVGAFGPASGRLTVSAEQEGVPVALFDLEPRAGGWNRAPVPQPFATRALLLEWQPESPGEALPEIELWGTEAAEVTGEEEPGGSRTGLGSPASLRIAEGATDGGGTFRVRLAADPATASRAFLSYELTGLSHWSSAVRSINGLTPQGWSATPAAESSLQTEEIDPAWLRAGINEIRFAPARAGAMPEEMAGERSPAALSKAGETVPYEVRNLRLVLVGEPGRTEAGPAWDGASPLELALPRPAQDDLHGLKPRAPGSPRDDSHKPLNAGAVPVDRETRHGRAVLEPAAVRLGVHGLAAMYDQLSFLSSVR